MSIVKTAIAFLNLTSAVLTGAGYFTYVRPWAESLIGAERGWIAALGIGFLFSLCVQTLVNAFWHRVAEEWTWRNSTTLLAAVLASATSWFGGASGALLVSSERDMVMSRQAEVGSATIAPLRAFAEANVGLAQELEALAGRATDLAESERQGRPTCTNDTSTGASCGTCQRL